jgi:cation transporter-like permease
MITTLISSTVAIIISFFSRYTLTPLVVLKIFAIAIVDVAILVVVLFFTSVLGGLYFFKKKEDPNNFLMPIMTSIADFGNMIILAVLVVLLF